jgi:hypothetical protein
MARVGTALQTKRTALERAYFGGNAAEFDRALQETFVETPIWISLLADRLDNVYGAKGAGKSAMALLLNERSRVLRANRILVVNAEAPDQEIIFEGLAGRTSLNEDQLTALWKLYLLTLLGYTLRNELPHDRDAQIVIANLQNAGLLSPEPSPPLARLLQNALHYVTIQANGGFQASVPGLPVGAQSSVSIVVHEPSPDVRRPGMVSVPELLNAAGRALNRARLTVWLVLDRLDVAFDKDEALEAKALQALFQTTLAFSPPAYRLKLKIFLRLDIWERISGQVAHTAGTGTRSSWAAAIQGERILWDAPTLRSLLARRLVFNKEIRDLYHTDDRRVRNSASEQQDLIERVFPPRMPVPNPAALALPGDPGPQPAFEWMLSQVRDGTGQVAPRELVELLTFARSAQIQRFSVGAAEALEHVSQLFEPEALEVAANDVSHARLHQTLYAEYPRVRDSVEALRGGRARFTSVDEFIHLWSKVMDREEAQRTLALLTNLGFFAHQPARPPEQPDESWVVPPVYARTLSLRR